MSPTAAPKCSPSSPICVPSSSFPSPHASVSTSTVAPAEPAPLSSKIRPTDDSEDTSRAAIEDTPHAAILRVDPNTPDNPRNISETTISAPPISPFPNSSISHRDASTVQLLADEVSPLAGATAVFLISHVIRYLRHCALTLRLRRILTLPLLLLTTFLMTSLDGASTVLLRSLDAIFLLIPWAPPSAEPLVLFPTPNYDVCVSAPLHAKFPVFCAR